MVFIRHILDETDYLIDKSVGLTYDDFIADATLMRAFARSLEIIGEASKNTSESFRLKHAEIKWKEIAGLRDKLIHQYFSIDWHILWDVVKHNIPELRKKLENIVNDTQKNYRQHL
ncbi:MAG: DUF86 domain-containing protein [Nitrospirae bacterium YQR-1]